jgi:Domain of unknown function (DUF6894)
VSWYRFHVFHDQQTIDRDGKMLQDLDEARAFAIELARQIMADEIKMSGEINLGHWIEIEDEHGEMDVVPFGEALRINSPADIGLQS